MEEKYAGLIKTDHDGWWLSLSRAVFDAWDLPEGPRRDMILGTAQAMGVLRHLGPSSMSSREAYNAAQKSMGLPEEGFDRFIPHTMRGYDFIHGTGEFSTEEEQ